MTLSEFFSQNNKVALGFSGGVDSSYLLYAALANNANIMPYFVKSPFQPQFELDDAKRLTHDLQCDMKIIYLDHLDDHEVSSNTEMRCYYCKKKIFTAIKDQAIADGYTVLLSGAQASDDEGNRPGMKATAELAVKSPLRDCGIDKAEVRRLSREAKLFTWDKPAYACLATRIKTSVPITVELLQKVEKSEDILFALGYKDFRVRTDGETATVQIRQDQTDKALMDKEKIYGELIKYFDHVVFDYSQRG